MLVIRNAQIKVFEEIQFRRFLDRMAAHLREHFPTQVEFIPEPELRTLIHAAADRAEDYGIKAERDLCRVLNLLVLFGWDFDAKPEGSWLRRLLSDPLVTSPGERVSRAVKSAVHRLEVEKSNREIRQRAKLERR